jgi:hypothetical protein
MALVNRIQTWTVAIFLGVALAAYDLITGWTVAGGVAAAIVVLGLFLGAFAMFGLMLRAVLKERKRLLVTPPEARAVLEGSARAMRWSGAFAIGLSVLLFTDCSGGVGSSGPNAPVAHALDVPSDFLWLAAGVLLPLVLALLLPPIFATGAQLLAERRPKTARTFATLAVWGAAVAAGAAVATVPVAFFLGVSACDFGTSVGYCAAGVGGLMNFFSLSSLALFLPYTGLLSWALARLEYDRANPT